ncbi:MAG: TonB family protein [Acidobacteria bacterium]|nr:TonB family protein [Acidobacteriota bacterium]
MKRLIIFLFVAVGFAPLGVSAQKKEKVETASQVLRAEASTKCTRLEIGKVESMPAPKYPSEARSAKIGGAVDVTVWIDETGRVTEVKTIDGPRALHGVTVEAALKARFAPTLCDNRPARITGVLSYSFIPLAPNERYFVARNIDDFKDVSKESPYYEAILDLTENYRITFGYGDRNFYPDLPMPLGDFAHSLRLTLDLLRKQAAIAKVDPANVYRPMNPRRVTIEDRFEFADPNAAYVESIKILVRDHQVSLFDEKNEFKGRDVIRRGELISIWKGVFGDDAIPVNFEEKDTENRVLSRGEFALFLQESMRVLTYKLLPVSE